MGEKWITGSVEEALMVEKGETERERKRERERRVYGGLHKENTSPRPLTGKMRRADFQAFLQQQGSKIGVLEVRGMAHIEP